MLLRPHLDQPGGEGGGGQGEEWEGEGEEETRAELQKDSRLKPSPAYFLTFCAMWRKQNAPKSSNAIINQILYKKVLLLFATLEAGEVLGGHLRLRLEAPS